MNYMHLNSFYKKNEKKGNFVLCEKKQNMDISIMMVIIRKQPVLVIGSYSIYNKNPSSPNHQSIYINYNTKTGKGNIVESNGSGRKTTIGIDCYLTTACIKHFKENFDDNCFELAILRWFRDNFVSQDDI